MKKRVILRRLVVCAILLSIYPVSVLGYTWVHVVHSDFEGGRHGELDAYRHTLASATVSFTLGEWAVTVVTSVCEGGGKDSNRMDIHNNKIGAGIGSKVSSFRELEQSVRQAVQEGDVNSSDPDQITWLPAKRWRDASLW